MTTTLTTLVLALAAAQSAGAGERPARIADLPPASRQAAQEMLEADRATAQRTAELLGRTPLALSALVDGLALELREERALGFGAAYRSYAAHAGLGQLSVEVITVADPAGVRCAQARLSFGCGGTNFDGVRPIEEFHAAVADAWPGSYEAAEPYPGLAHAWEDPAAWRTLERKMADVLGARPRLEVPPELAADVELLTSPFQRLTFGDTGGIAGLPLPGRLATDRLVEAGRPDLLRTVLHGWNPAGRVFAAEALLASGEPTPDDRRAIAGVRALEVPIPYCDGGCTITSATAAALLDPL